MGDKARDVGLPRIKKVSPEFIQSPPKNAKANPAVELLKTNELLREEIRERRKAEEALRHANQHLKEEIRQRQKAEEALRSERDRAQKLLDVAGAMFVMVSADETVGLINKKGCDVLGQKESEIIGKNWFDSYIPDSIREAVRSAFRNMMQGRIETVEYFENPVSAADGSERIISWHNTVLKDDEGRIQGTLSSGLDITDRVDLEGQIRQSEKLAAVGKIASGLAHEIGTPLGVIAGRAEYMLRKLDGSDPLKGNLEKIIAQIDRIVKIVNQLLSFARSRPLEVRSIQLKEVVDNGLLLFEHQVATQDIRKILDFPEGLPAVQADPDQILQVFFNIIHNAIQAMPAGGELSIRAARTVSRKQRENSMGDRFVRVEISDTGEGISEASLPKIFDPFFSTKEAGQGTGLGLSVSYGIIQRHGGRIDVKSRKGEGSVFCVYLPIHSPFLHPKPSGEAVADG